MRCVRLANFDAQPFVTSHETGVFCWAGAQHRFDLNAVVFLHLQAQALGWGGRGWQHAHAMRAQQFGARQFQRAMYPIGQLGLPGAPAQVVKYGQQVAFLQRPALAALPQCAHHVVQAVGAFAAQR